MFPYIKTRHSEELSVIQNDRLSDIERPNINTHPVLPPSSQDNSHVINSIFKNLKNILKKAGSTEAVLKYVKHMWKKWKEKNYCVIIWSKHIKIWTKQYTEIVFSVLHDNLFFL